MATYRTAPNLGKPPAPETLTKRGRRASEAGAAAMRAAAGGRSWEKGRQRVEPDAYPGPHPLPVERIGVAELTGSAKSLAKHAEGIGLRVLAASNGREVEVRIGQMGEAYARVVFRDGRLVHAFVLEDGSMRKRTLTAVKAALAGTITP